MPNDEMKCVREHCYVPGLGETCNDGHLDVNKCSNFRGHQKTRTRTVDDKAEGDGFHFPWSGNSLGLNDFSFISGRSRPRIIGVIGPQNAGKTTILTVLYLLLSRGNISEDHKFAGSYSFGGWENLAHYLRWNGSIPPTFPPHTSSADNGRPGLLHLSFHRKNHLLDLVLTDAPGEWFSRWALDKNHKDGGGAKWTAANSDALILVVDCESLAGPNRGQARESSLRIAERLRSEIADAPVLVVWAKSDVPVKDSIKKPLESDLTKLFPDHQSLSVSAKREGDSNQITESAFRDLWRWILTSRPFSGKGTLSLKARSDDLFLMFRG
jgi:hypothetical protein